LLPLVFQTYPPIELPSPILDLFRMAGRTCSSIVSAMLAVAALPGADAVPANKLRAKAAGSDSNLHARTRTPLVDQHLTICNAYPSSSALDVLHVDQQVLLTQSQAIKYKECREFTFPLMEGDRLDFTAGGLDVGTFHATSMPKTSASLLLIPRRRDASSRSLAFESHAFANLKSPQIAVIDAFRGNKTGLVHIKESPKHEGKPSRKASLVEALRFSSVVAVAPGEYDLSLAGDESNSNITALPLRVSPHAKCVVMRVGGGFHQGVAFPQELVIFSNWATSSLRSAWLPVVTAFLFLASLF